MKYALASMLTGCLIASVGCDQRSQDDGTKQFQGTWEAVDRDGKRLNQQAVFEKDVVYVQTSKAEEGATSVGMSAPDENGLERSFFRLDKSATPMRIDFVCAEGSNNGKTREGIVSFDDDKRMKICVAPYDTPRPTEFVAGDRTILLVLQRAN